jgi:hypothetical protein
MLAKLIAIATIALTSSANPLYKQCDTRWGSDSFGTPSKTNTATICKSGCLVSSAAMVLAGCGKIIDKATVTPKSLNTWLKNNNGYAGNLLYWERLGNLGLSFVGKVNDPKQISAYHKQGKAVVLNVKNGGHWVLLTGISVGKNGLVEKYLVNDPGYSVTSYAKSDVLTAGIFSKPSGC